MLLPLILFSRLSFFTVVPLRAAISDRVSPWRIVTLRPPRERFFLLLPRLAEAELWLRELEVLLREYVGVVLFTSTSVRFASNSSGR